MSGVPHLNFCAHCIQAFGQIDHLWLHRRISITVSPRASEPAISITCVAPTETLGKVNRLPIRPPFGVLVYNIAVLNVDLCAKRLQAVDEKIDRTRADGASAGQGNARIAHARQKRADDPERGAHLRNQFIGRGRGDNVAGQ